MSSKPITNKEIVQILEEIALYLRAENVAFKPQAYETAAENIQALQEELTDLYKTSDKNCIYDIPGVGKSIAEKIEELVTTGKLSSYTALKKKYPFDMLALSRIQEVGPKTALKLYKELGVKTVSDLERAAEAKKIQELPGMGYKSEQNILRGIRFLKDTTSRRLIHDVLPFAQRIVQKLQTSGKGIRVEIAGSLRRRKETIGDVDLLATTSSPHALIQTFKRLLEIDEVLEEGKTKLMVRYKNGLNGDLRILSPEKYGAALVHFTGSREHNILLRERAIKKHMKLSEYGIAKGKKHITCRTEEQVYHALGLQWIPPELRVGDDEVKYAERKKIPTLIPYGSVKGDLQIQTKWTDGIATIEEMARAAKAYGLSYIAITDHTRSLAWGLDEKQLKTQGKEIDRVNKKLKRFKVLKSTECDIRKDGTLDLSDTMLKTLDLVCVSVHSHRNLGKDEMTERIVKALKHPLVHVFFHPTGRIVGKRGPYELDMDRLMKAAKIYGVALEVNGSERLDLHEHYIRQALDMGVKLVVNSDAHAPEHYSFLDHGLAQARKGWARKADIINTKPLKQCLAALRKKN